MTKISIRFFNDREVRAAWDETPFQIVLFCCCDIKPPPCFVTLRMGVYCASHSFFRLFGKFYLAKNSGSISLFNASKSSSVIDFISSSPSLLDVFGSMAIARNIMFRSCFKAPSAPSIWTFII